MIFHRSPKPQKEEKKKTKVNRVWDNGGTKNTKELDYSTKLNGSQDAAGLAQEQVEPVCTICQPGPEGTMTESQCTP